MFDAFSPFPLRFSSGITPYEQQYNALAAQLGPGFEGPVQEPIVYGIGTALGAAQLQQEGAAAQADPLQCTALLPYLEADYQIVPNLSQSINERQLVLDAAKNMQVGALESTIEAGLQAILGDDFVNWRWLDPDTEVVVACGDNVDVSWVTRTPEIAASTTVGDVPGAILWNSNMNRWTATDANSPVTYPMKYSDDDGATWHDATSMTTDATWRGLATDGEFVMAVGNDTTGPGYENVALTLDSETWIVIDSTVSGDFRAVEYGAGNRWVAVGDSVAMYSDNTGTSWATTTIDAQLWTSIAYGNNVWVATSPDGYIATASNVSSGFTTSTTSMIDIVKVAFGNGVFVAVSSSYSPRAQWSRDGVTWNDSADLAESAYNDLAFSGELFFAVDPDNSLFSYSENGASWSLIPHTATATASQRLGAKPNKLVSLAPNESASVRFYPRPDLVPVTTAIKIVSLDSTVMSGTQTVSYTPIITDGNPLQVNEIVTVEAGRIGRQEQIRITAVTDTTFTGVFKHSHSAGSRATTANFPVWTSTRRHSLVLVAASVLENPTLLAQVNLFMRKIMPANATWAVVPGDGGYTEPFVVGSSLGMATVGRIPEADPT